MIDIEAAKIAWNRSRLGKGLLFYAAHQTIEDVVNDLGLMDHLRIGNSLGEIYNDDKVKLADADQVKQRYYRISIQEI